MVVVMSQDTKEKIRDLEGQKILLEDRLEQQDRKIRKIYRSNRESDDQSWYSLCPFITAREM